jgi:cell filamentation protein
VPGYTLGDGSTLKNKLGATSHDELERLEVDYVKLRQLDFEFGHGPSGNFDTAHLKAIHRHLFQDVYEWAGHTRAEKVKLSDGSVATEPLMRKMDGQPFMAGPQIAKALDHVSAELRKANYLRGLPREEFAHRAADIMAEINGAHAFREGNGRTQRVFIGEVAKQAGHDLDFTVVSRERMIEASIAANEQGDTAMMRRLFDEISTPSRVAALTPAINFLEGQGFPWNDRYVATMEPGFPVDVTFAGGVGEHFMARTGSGILIGQVADLPTPTPGRGDACRIEPSRWP